MGRASIVAEEKVAWSGSVANLPAFLGSSRRDHSLPVTGTRTSLEESPWTSKSAARRHAGLNAITIITAMTPVLVAELLSDGGIVPALTVVVLLSPTATAECDIRAMVGRAPLVLLIGVFFSLLG